MENKKSDKQQTNAETKKPSSQQPSYGDKPWQTPQYGEKNKNKNVAEEEQEEESCGCGSDSQEEGKKGQSSSKNR